MACSFLSGPDLLIKAVLLDRGVQLTSRHDAMTLSADVIEHVRLVKRGANEYRASRSANEPIREPWS